jgi:hypothetical protein
MDTLLGEKITHYLSLHFKGTYCQTIAKLTYQISINKN